MIGPTEHTVDDFWTMIWQEHCSTIAMLTNLVECGVSFTNRLIGFSRVYCMKGNIRSHFIFFFFCPRCQRENLRFGEFQCLKLSLYKNNCMLANSRRGETVCRRANHIRYKNKPVYSIRICVEVTNIKTVSSCHH